MTHTADHSAEARGWTERAWARMSGPGSLEPFLRVDAQREQMIATAQVHATLAEATEQRTSNLIARWDALRNPPVNVRPTPEQWAEIERLDREIHARLGVETPEDGR